MDDKIEIVPLSALEPDGHNANKGSERGTYMIRRSLEKLGAGRSILVDKNGRIIAGNKTAESAGDVGIEDVILVRTRGNQLVAVMREDLDLDDPTGEARQLAYADKRAGEVSLTWDVDALQVDIDAGVDLSDWFQPLELDEIITSEAIEEPTTNYSRKIEPPIYTPSEVVPEVTELFNDSKTRELISAIENEEMPDEVRAFLIMAAQRHTVFNYSKIADYYASAPPEIQRHMENSALVIIDFQRAIENGFVNFTGKLREMYAEEYPDG